MAHMRNEFHGIDEAGYIGGSMEERWILLGQNLTQLRVGILGSRDG